MTAFSGHKDLAYGTVLTAPSPALSGTTLTLDAGQGALMPSTLPFWATAAPALTLPTVDVAELVLVTNVVGDVLTITRGQAGIAAKAIAVGWQFYNGVASGWGTEVENAINATETALAAHISDPTGAHAASAISNVPAGIISATDVQSAIDELASEIPAALAGAVILAPATTARNVIQPTVATAIPLTVKGHATQSVDILDVQKSDGGKYVRVGATGAVGIGIGTYDPALYGGYLTGLVLSRASDNFWDSGDNDPFTPNASQSVYGTFIDVETVPTADGAANFTEARAMTLSVRLGGNKTIDTLMGAYLESVMRGSKAAGSGVQAAYQYGALMHAYQSPGTTGDIGEIAGSWSNGIGRGVGAYGEVIGARNDGHAGGNAAATYATGIVGTKSTAAVFVATGAAIPSVIAHQSVLSFAFGGRAVTVAKGLDVGNAGHASVVTSYGAYIAAQSGATNVYALYAAGGRSVFIDSLITGKIALPADADFANGQGAWWWDQASEVPKWKGKKSDGTVINFTPDPSEGEPLFIQDIAPVTSATKYMWIETAGSDLSFWVEGS